MSNKSPIKTYKHASLKVGQTVAIKRGDVKIDLLYIDPKTGNKRVRYTSCVEPFETRNCTIRSFEGYVSKAKAQQLQPNISAEPVKITVEANGQKFTLTVPPRLEVC